MDKLIEIQPKHRAIKAYYEELKEYERQGVANEMAVRSAFQNLLSSAVKLRKWTLITEISEKVGDKRVRPDGTVRDQYHLPRGYWEAKDTKDNLDDEIRKKLAKGYPSSNIIFDDTRTGILIQNGQELLRADLRDAKKLAELLNQFLKYETPNIEQFEKAISEFAGEVPEIGARLRTIIEEAHKENKKFQGAFDGFFELCKTALNPNISKDAIDEMLIQHLLTERVIRTVFDDPDFTRRNVIASEVEKIIAALTSKSFSRSEFLRSLDRFYVAVESAAKGLNDYSDKQQFLNTVYERFFQGYAVKVADTHGIVYTPQPIVDFMCSSVQEVLKEEFGKDLGSKDVFILDPCTGTGNFIVNIIKRISGRDLKRVYREQLFANEVMLMPYYIASLNIEHAFYEKTGEYDAFEGLCFVDTLDLVGSQQGELGFMTKANALRVKRQAATPITVIIGNPPYNVGQLNENDNNKNRKYPVIDKRVKETFAKDSRATNKNALSDSYVKFYRWAIDRLQGRDGIVCFISNNSFVENLAFDGMRLHLFREFSRIYHLDLHGNVRKNPKLSGTSHNVFGIQVGVGITVAIRRSNHKVRRLQYHRVPEDWRKELKYDYLVRAQNISGVKWKLLKPNNLNSWLQIGHSSIFSNFVPLGFKESKASKVPESATIFKIYGRGVATCRDDVVYDYQRDVIEPRVRQFIEDYNSEVERYQRYIKTKSGDKPKTDGFVNYDKIKWSRDLKLDLERGKIAEFNDEKIRFSIYRPFNKRYLFFDRILNEEVYILPKIYPNLNAEWSNPVICTSGIGSTRPFQILIAPIIPCLDLLEKTQCFPYYTYNEDGTGKRENITDWALKRFREQYKDNKISKWDIFYYIYGILHHPGYRAKYAENLRRELPRIPFAPDFDSFAKAGERLAKWHLEYEKIEPYELKFMESKDVPYSTQVEDKMRLSKDKKSLVVNRSLTLAGIPAECFEYRLGNRSALEWVIDQYQVKVDKRSGIKSDPNRLDDPDYIVRLVGQVIRVSLETVKIVKALPKDFGG